MKFAFGRHRLEPAWRVQRQLSTQPPQTIEPWLFDSGSLTRRLIQACSGQFSVEVISQAWQRPMLNESRRLGLPAHRFAWVRQVRLYCDDQAWVFARTVIPPSSLRGPLQYLANLGTRPLGAVLFSEPTMRRDALEVCCLRSEHRMYSTATQHLAAHGNNDCLWGRRSVFYLHAKPLLVSEIFLPGIPPCPAIK